MNGKGKISFAVVAILVAAISSASAALLDNIDSYTVGENLIGKPNWTGWAGDMNPAYGAPVSNAVAHSGANSIEIGGGDPANWTDLVYQFSGVTSGEWTFTTMTYIPSSSTTGNYPAINFMSSHPAPLAWGGEMKFLIESDEVLYAGAPAQKTAMLRDQWVEAKLIVNLDTKDASMYYGGTPLGNFTWGGPAELAAIDLWAPAGSNPIYYDDLTLVPEPAALPLFLLGVVGMLAGFSRRRGARVGSHR